MSRLIRCTISTASTHKLYFTSFLTTRTLSTIYSPLHCSNLHEACRFQSLGSFQFRCYSAPSEDVTPKERRVKRRKITKLEKELHALIQDTKESYYTNLLSVDSQAVRNSGLGLSIARMYCELSRLRYSICETKHDFAEDDDIEEILVAPSTWREMDKLDFRPSSVPTDELQDAAFQECVKQLRKTWRLVFENGGVETLSYMHDNQRMFLVSNTLSDIFDYLDAQKEEKELFYCLGTSEDIKEVPVARDWDLTIFKGTNKDTATPRILIINAERGNFVKGRAQAVAQLMELSEYTSCVNLFAIVTTAVIWSPLMLRVKDKKLYCGNDLIIDVHNGHTAECTFPHLEETVHMMKFMLDYSTTEVDDSHLAFQRKQES